jgi:hypothetical protein
VTPSERLLHGVLLERAVVSAALFGSDRSVDQRGAELPVGSLGDVAAAVRHVFRQTSPPIHVLDLAYANGRVVLVPWGDSVLFLHANAAIDLDALLARVRGEVPPVHVLRDGAAAADRAAAAPPAVSPTVVLEVLNAISLVARATLGGPVIRNYLRRALKELEGAYAVLAELNVDLEGRVSLRDSSIADATLGRAAGALARAFLVRASVVVPELGSLDLRAIAAANTAMLEANGFFAIDTEKGKP